MYGVGWTPTDAGFVLNFEEGDQFLLSVWIDLDSDGVEDAGEEFFVCDYPSYNGKSGGRFNYEAKDYLKLVPQASGATTPSAASVWTVGEKLKHSTKVNGESANFTLDGICYTMWGNSSHTLYAAESPTKSSTFKVLGWLTDNANHGDVCDVALVVPSDNSRTKSMDPNNTLGRGGKFNGRMGTGFAGMTYREVYWFAIPRNNGPISYTNAALVTFNTTNSNKSWSAGTIKPGFAAYAYADTKHNPTTRTVFRIYVLNEKAFSSCNSYFFGWDVQDYVRYRNNANTSAVSYTGYRKIYTLDHFECMDLVEEGKSYYQTQGMKIPSNDSTYYYVGKNNTYFAASPFNGKYLGSSTSEDAKSAFKHISELRIRQLKDKGDYRPSKNAFGYLAVDTTLAENNLGVSFEPAGYFFQTNSGVNVRMRPVNDSTWMVDDMWYIDPEYMKLQARIMLYTGEEFSPTDPGAAIEGWSVYENATDIPVVGGGTASGQYGWARIHTNRAAENGDMEFVTADKDKYIQYNYNGHFGAPIPNTHPEYGKTKVAVQDPRLLGDYEFICWTNVADTTTGPFTKYYPGDSVTLSGVLPLYAQAKYKGSINLAISFMQGDKRYFLTHPGTAPRFARARTFTEWTDVYQGMSDAENSEPNYVSTYKMIVNPVCELCAADEVVLDPHHETMHGSVDSLTFYEYWTPANDEYIGLYYEATPNTVIANNTWAGIFKSTGGWPTPANPCIASTKIYSTDYFTGMKTKEYTKNSRGALSPYIKYNSTDNQFDGDSEANATNFMISGVGVVDEHYIILPDTTDASTPWRSAVEFGYHTEPQHEQIWSKLIGKQLLAQMKVGDDTIYFHPNRDKIFNTATELRLSGDFRLRHEFEFIPDQRAAFSSVDEANRVTMEETGNAFCCNLYSGASSPIGPTVDIVDTLRVWLRPASTSKIKKYYGRWKKGADGLHIQADGSRYHDILVKTKTYHEGAIETRLVLKPEQDSYNFGALANQSQTLNFLLLKETSQAMLDASGAETSRRVLATDTVTDVLDLSTAGMALKESTIFTVGTKTATGITLRTKTENASGVRIDTLTVTIGSITVGGQTYSSVTAKVPLTQSSMQGDELVWSVVHPTNGKRIFIMAGKNGEGVGRFVFREYSLRDNTLYKYNTTTPLKKGVKTVANDDNQYITPWTFAFNPSDKNQVSLKTEDGVDKYLGVSGDDADLKNAGTYFTYRLIATNANANANYEEVVRIKYGADKWLTYNGSALVLQADSASASLFYWGYLQQEYQLLNNGAYPSVDELVFGYNNGSSKSVTMAYKAYREYSMLLNNTLTYLCREEEEDYADLVDGGKDWKTTYTTTLIPDARDFDGTPDPTSGLGKTTTNFTTTVTPASATSPKDVTIAGKYVNIVDTLQVTLNTDRTDYRFKDWTGVSSVSDACLKIPLVRKTYHDEPYDSIMCQVEMEEYNFAFPSTLRKDEPEDSLHTFYLETILRSGTSVLDADGLEVSYTPSKPDTLTELMKLEDPALAEIRLVDEYGNIPDWCEIEEKKDNTLTVRCKSNGIRTPRSAYLYFAYVVEVGGKYRYVNFKLTVSQASLFQYANNQTLIHMPGASGDPLMTDGRQQAHENKRILYYYNPKPYDEPDQNVELPVRERGYYGWWRWYREGNDQNKVDVSDTDIPDSVWITPPRNVGKYNYPFRIIGDSVDAGGGKKKLVTMGRYTVFRYPSKGYSNKQDPPSKSPKVMAPWNKDTVTYVVDISNYYDNLPLSMAQVNQIDTAVLDTMKNIQEPTLSLREAFELHPWTEMAAILDGYKDTIASETRNQKYMEDHEVMAPIGNRLLLRTEQRYRYDNLIKKGHSESLLGYYMRDDHWSDGGWTDARKDTMIWCGGWDAECEWYTYNPSSKTYTPCSHPVTVEDDFLNVPAKGSITSGHDADTVIYCLRARSKSTTRPSSSDVTTDGAYWFNICRYKVIYHNPRKYGPYEETGTGSAAKAIITNDEIEQNYEVLERLNFDYVKPGNDYHIYPHPLPWADASYGYNYPVTPEIPNNRYHDEKDFPGPGEYALINKIPYSTYWRKLEQHGGAANGYMIYCDGMSSAGQVAALSLNTQLCEGQKMYFSGYIGNVSNQTGKSNPNFTFSVQGWDDKGKNWVDITSYMTGDIQPSDKWYQIYFPINQEGSYDQFRIRIYNVASSFDGNDFVIDDMCVFATKPPLMAYQADTKCVEEGKNDSITQVVLRLDYQGFVDESFNNTEVYYTVEQIDKDSVRTFVPMEDEYINQSKLSGADESKPDTLYGYIRMPAHTYIPLNEDSIFTDLQQLVDTFNHSNRAFRQGYLFENLDGITRPVMYVLHEAKMTADNTYNVRMSLSQHQLMDSKCAMTSNLKVTNRMMLELNGEELDKNKDADMCANTTYDLSVRVKGSRYLPGTAPVDANGSCINDWLLYGDTVDASSLVRYGYKYSDIKKVVKDILRHVPAYGTNRNQHVRTLTEINRNDLAEYAKVVTLSDGVTAYQLLSDLVSKGFLTLYQSKITTSVAKGDSIQYVVFPIFGTGSDAMHEENMEVCTAPMFIKLKPNKGGNVPMTIGGILRDSTQANLPVVVLVDAETANDQFKIHIDSLMPTTAIHSIHLLSTDDPECYEGVHLLTLEPDRIFNHAGDNSGYYRKGDDILLRPATSNNYQMKEGYNYTFGIVMQGLTGSLTTAEDCPVGTVPFTVSVVPHYLRWAPKSKDNNKWNNPENWIGLNEDFEPIHANAHFVPLPSTDVIIPNLLPDGLPYPEIPDPSRIAATDSVKQVNFAYNTCDDIRFLAGAAIGQQQRLICDVVVADMTIPQQTWALRSAPVTGMLSGDIFMADADLNGENKPWYVGEFDASGRSYKTGNASFWLSLYNKATEHVVRDGSSESVTASAEWSKVTNGLTLSLPAASGYAVYARTASGDPADIRLPKNDDVYYYYGTYGERLDYKYEDNLRALRNTYASEGEAGMLAYYPGAEAGHQDYTLTNAVASTSFVFGNPTMGYIDIWGFIEDNSLTAEISYLDAEGRYTTVTSETAGSDTITNHARYLPPMHAMMITVSGEDATSLDVTLNANRIVTNPSQKVRGGGAPVRRAGIGSKAKGIMTVTAINPVSDRCVSRLLLGQGYDDMIRSGEDAILTTLNIDKFHMTNTPTTPFNIYAIEGAYGLSIDLRSDLLNVPVSFFMSELPYESVTQLWFTGVNTINGELVLYDALTDTERSIIDGICLDIETPEISHEKRYYIRRRGFNPNAGNDPNVATDVQNVTGTSSDEVQKILRHGQVYILRSGHVYSVFGQKIR